MSVQTRLAFVLCLLSLCLAVSVLAQDEPKIISSLNDTKTVADVYAYIRYEGSKVAQSLSSSRPKERAVITAGITIPASDKILEIATNPEEKRQGYNMKFFALGSLAMIEAEEDAEQKLETFFKELAAQKEFEEMAEEYQCTFLMQRAMMKGVKTTEEKIEAFFKELDAKEKTKNRTAMIDSGRFFLFYEKANKAKAAPENFDQFKSELKEWLNSEHVSPNDTASLGLEVAYRNNVPAEQIIKELTGYVQSPQCTVPAERKEGLIETLEKTLRLAVGADPKLYGKTLDDKDFDWESLRGKYVLIKFTGTWCGPCKMQIPGMLEAYKKYKDKGLEIVSVYIEENASDPVAAVKKDVEEEKLPWIILSEELTKKAGQPGYREFYSMKGVPTMVLADKEGKIMIPSTHGDEWKAKLAEIFK